MNRIFKIIVFLVLSLSLALPAVAANYDLVIKNGRVMDPETMFDSVANVGIKDGRIAVITKNEITGKETIDATGHVVAPGFIDGHQHCVDPYIYRLMVRDGRTTIMDLEMEASGIRHVKEKRRSILAYRLHTNLPVHPYWMDLPTGNFSTHLMPFIPVLSRVGVRPDLPWNKAIKFFLKWMKDCAWAQ